MTIELQSFSGRFWRMLSIRWQRRPFESGSHHTGGRWNRPGTSALYLSADHATAIAEMHQELVRPGTLVAFDLVSHRIADLRHADPVITASLWRDIFQIERAEPPSWPLADELIGAGAEGALVPSVQNRGGTNLVLWRWHDAASGPGEGAALTLIDPDAALR